MIPRGNVNLMKEINKKNILNIIRRNQPISRARIAEMSSLASSTVTSIVGDLIEEGLVKETTKGKSRGGRRPIMLELNTDSIFICGFEWGIAEIKSVLVNLNCELIDSQAVAVEQKDLNYFLTITESMLSSYQAKLISGSKIFGVGFGVHGIVDASVGKLLLSPHFRWENVLLRQKLEQTLGMSIAVDNDVRMMACAEKWSGLEEFIFIHSGYGIGAAIVLNNQLYRGKNWSAGEFGHMIIVEDGPKCICGNRGCLDALVSLPKLVAQHEQKENGGLSLAEMNEKWLEIVEKARKGQQAELALLKDTGKYLGRAMANVINLLNPGAIIVGGSLVVAEDLVFAVIWEQIEKYVLKTSKKDIEIRVTQFGDLVGAIGAACKVLEEIFVVNGRS